LKRIALSPRDRRALRLLAFIAVPILLHALVVRPYRTLLGNARMELEQERDRLARERGLVEHTLGYRAAMHATDSALDAAYRRLFRGPNRPLAEAEFTTYVQQVAELSEISLQSLSVPGGDSLAGGVLSTRVQVRGEAELEPLLLFLHRLEHGPGLVRMQELTIQPAGARRTSLLLASVTSPAGALTFDLAFDGHLDVREVPEAVPITVATGRSGS
jgi:hypothetical protein